MRHILEHNAASKSEEDALRAEVMRLRQSGEFRDQALETFLLEIGEETGDLALYPRQLRAIAERYKMLARNAQRRLSTEVEDAHRSMSVLTQAGRFAEAASALSSFFMRSHSVADQTSRKSDRKKGIGVALKVDVRPNPMRLNDKAILTIEIANRRTTPLYKAELFVKPAFNLVRFGDHASFAAVCFRITPRSFYTTQIHVLPREPSQCMTEQISATVLFQEDKEGPYESLSVYKEIQIV